MVHHIQHSYPTQRFNTHTHTHTHKHNNTPSPQKTQLPFTVLPQPHYTQHNTDLQLWDTSILASQHNTPPNLHNNTHPPLPTHQPHKICS
ncbi:hypothetical protein FKM82_014292 [Ascaphus truei]